MSAHLQKTIELLEQQLAAIEIERAEVTRVIESLRPYVVTGGAVARRGGRKTAKRKRTNERTNERKPRAARAPRSLPDRAVQKTFDEPRQRLDLVPARDAAITTALKSGAKPAAQLLAALPKEPGQTADQRDGALRNALTRLRIKKVVEQTDEGWALR